MKNVNIQGKIHIDRINKANDIENKYVEEYLELIFRAYWTEGKDISNENCLSEIVEELSESSESFLIFIYFCKPLTGNP